MENEEMQTKTVPKLRCPTKPRFEGDLIGCGSTNISEADDEGLHDCLDCGLWFRADAAENP